MGRVGGLVGVVMATVIGLNVVIYNAISVVAVATTADAKTVSTAATVGATADASSVIVTVVC